MHIFFAGIGGVGIGPLAEIARDAGYTVSGSDREETLMAKQLKEKGITVHIGTQDGSFVREMHNKTPIDWLVYSTAMPADNPELVFAHDENIRISERDELLAHIIEQKNLKLIAIAGTHGKTTTTGMMIWAMQQQKIPVSYSIGTTISYGPSGAFDPASEYFIYECDEFNRNFLHFSPYISLLTSIDYDHPDTYSTIDNYRLAFSQFINQSSQVVMWQRDADYIGGNFGDAWILQEKDVSTVELPGEHNRHNATLVVKALERLGIDSIEHNTKALETFPGTDRRFEKLANSLYTDYGHHPVEIAATLQLAREISNHVVLVYQPHQNVRQHELLGKYTDQFELAEHTYWLPTYLSREDPDLPILTPETLYSSVTNSETLETAALDDSLWDAIQKARSEGKLVLCMGAGNIDTWVRKQLDTLTIVNVILRDKSGSFIMQIRDDKPDISNPGQTTFFGGHVEPDDTSLVDAAARELREETSLTVNPRDLRYYKTYRKTISEHGENSYVTFFIAENIDTANLKVFEGQGYKIVSKDSDIQVLNCSKLASQVLNDLQKP